MDQNSIGSGGPQAERCPRWFALAVDAETSEARQREVPMPREAPRGRAAPPNSRTIRSMQRINTSTFPKSFTHCKRRCHGGVEVVLLMPAEPQTALRWSTSTTTSFSAGTRRANGTRRSSMGDQHRARCRSTSPPASGRTSTSIARRSALAGRLQHVRWRLEADIRAFIDLHNKNPNLSNGSSSSTRFWPRSNASITRLGRL